MNKIKLSNVSKIYDETVQRVETLKNINLEFEQGKLISISGHSGIGKSTLLFIIGGLIDATSGDVYYNDKKLNDFSGHEMDNFRAKEMSFIFQEYQFVQALNLRDNLVLSTKVNTDLNHLQIEAKIDEYLKRLNLFERKLFYPNQLSGGQKRRAMFISGIIKKSSFILADEPTNDLEEGMVNEMMKILAEEKEKGRGIILVTHNEEITKNADLRYSLKSGSLNQI